jgi:mono/diheme cytochrome c family protein
MKRLSLLAIGTLSIAATAFAAGSTKKGGAAAKGPKETPALLDKGKAAFTTNCASCHGELGDGKGPVGAVLDPKPRNFAVDAFKNGDKPEQIFKTITEGIPGTPMAAWAQLPDEDRWGLVFYVLKLKRGGK